MKDISQRHTSSLVRECPQALQLEWLGNASRSEWVKQTHSWCIVNLPAGTCVGRVHDIHQGTLCQTNKRLGV